MTWYNMFRKNLNKQHKQPRDILNEVNFEKTDYLLTSPPIFVDNYVKDLELVKGGGYLKWLSPKQ